MPLRARPMIGVVVMNESEIQIRTEHWPEAAKPYLSDYWLAWANGVQGDGETKQEAIENAKNRLATSSN